MLFIPSHSRSYLHLFCSEETFNHFKSPVNHFMNTKCNTVTHAISFLQLALVFIRDVHTNTKTRCMTHTMGMEPVSLQFVEKMGILSDI